MKTAPLPGFDTSAEPISPLGIQPNVIYNEDCLATMSRMHEGLVDMVLTSPPYDDMRSYEGNTFNEFDQLASELYRIVKEGGAVVWVVGDATKNGDESGTSFRQALHFKEVGFKLFDTMIYTKPPRGACGNNRGYWQSFEYMFVFSKGSLKTINLLMDRQNKDARTGDRSNKRYKDGSLKAVQRAGYGNHGRRTNIWEYRIGKGHSASSQVAHEHPAIFPEKLAGDHILSWSNEGELIYDPFMGSGTTAVMAERHGRQYIGSEICKNYCHISRQRLCEV